MGHTWSGYPSLTFHTNQWTLNFMMLVVSQKLGRWLVGWLCLTSHRHRGHLETASPFTVPCESVLYPPGLEPRACGVQIHYAILSSTATSLLNCTSGQSDLFLMLPHWSAAVQAQDMALILYMYQYKGQVCPALKIW